MANDIEMAVGGSRVGAPGDPKECTNEAVGECLLGAEHSREGGQRASVAGSPRTGESSPKRCVAPVHAGREASQLRDKS